MRGTLIDTPAGAVPVERIMPGLSVWSLDDAGKRIAVPVIETGSTPRSSTIPVVRLTLSDGRSVAASPGHPDADGRPLGSLKPGDAIDGATVATIEVIDYDGGATFDILPAGPAGVYFANGILLKSTLSVK